MKNPKDRLHRVTVIGATPAGITAANKLGELGIPVTLVDSDPDLDEKLSREEWRMQSGVTFNHAHRPGLIRILRNPVIRCIFPARVHSIKHSRQGFRIGLSRLQTFVDPDKCTLCGRCVEVCPVLLPEGEKAIGLNSRRSIPGRPVIDKRRRPLCQESCPLGVNVQGYIALTKAGKFAEALDLIRQDNILPGICGRICTRPCENACRRSELDEPIAIRDIKRFLSDQERTEFEETKPAHVQKRTEKIAVVGSGPAGLAAAADLARFGYPVTVFEKEKEAGGLLRYGIGPHRLPRDILDNELRYIEKLGVAFLAEHPVNLANDIGRLRKEFDAVILAVGTWADRKLNVPGETLKGVETCLAFLNRLHRHEIKSLKEKVAVIGDGNAAFDLARTLVRLGAAVTILSWFPEDLIPADAQEIQASREEGITLLDRVQTIEFLGQNGKLVKLRCAPTRPGEPDAQGICWPVIVPGSRPFELEFDRAFVAIGQKGALKGDKHVVHFNVSEKGLIETDHFLHTNITGVYATGDAVSGPTSVVECMAAGRQVARMVHNDMCKDQAPVHNPLRPEENDYLPISANIPRQPRPPMPEMQPSLRIRSFSEVAMGQSEVQVHAEATRCLQCGVCSECRQCVDACGAIQAINHYESGAETFDHTGVTIIADPEIAPPVKGEDVIRAYGPKAAKTDINAMMLRGFAAAAEAVVLLGGTSQRTRGHGLSFSPPDPGLSPEIRVGLFACKCNESLGWLEDMSRYVEGLRAQEDVIHAEIIPSACTPEGTAVIIRTIREKGITRVALASCACCPLNFVCSACTDQRSRLKNALFTGTGISRSMVETCNLRGEVLRLVNQNESLALKKFTGLIDRSIRRARRLKSLPGPVRSYNFTTAVIGTSEAATNSALMLAGIGLEVFWFKAAQEPMTETPDHPNIYRFSGVTIRELSGTMGNFRVVAETGDARQVLPVGAIILDEKSRRNIPYVHQEGLPGRIVSSVRQEMGVPGIPFFYPCSTAISGLFLAEPPGIKVSSRQKGAAAAIHAATVMPRGPRQSKGYTVLVDESKCRSCGRCIRVCPYRAVTLNRNGNGGWFAWVDEALCKGCGNCISVCPSNAADSTYRDQAALEQTIERILQTEKYG